jgi:hypothetical protein
MRNFHGWKAVARDALCIYVLSILLGTLLGMFWKMPVPPSSTDIWLRVGLGFLIGIVAYGVVGIITKEMMWRHLFRISVVLILLSFFRNIAQFSIQLPELGGIMIFNAIWMPFLQYSIALVLGGIIASSINILKRRNVAAS